MYELSKISTAVEIDILWKVDAQIKKIDFSWEVGAYLSNERVTAGGIEDVEHGLPQSAQFFTNAVAGHVKVARNRLPFNHCADTELWWLSKKIVRN